MPLLGNSNKRLLIIEHPSNRKKPSRVIAEFKDPNLAYSLYMKMNKRNSFDYMYELVKMDILSEEYRDLMENDRYEGWICYGRPRRR